MTCASSSVPRCCRRTSRRAWRPGVDRARTGSSRCSSPCRRSCWPDPCRHGAFIPLDAGRHRQQVLEGEIGAARVGIRLTEIREVGHQLRVDARNLRRAMAMPTSVEVMLLVADCIVCSGPCMIVRDASRGRSSCRGRAPGRGPRRAGRNRGRRSCRSTTRPWRVIEHAGDLPVRPGRELGIERVQRRRVESFGVRCRHRPALGRPRLVGRRWTRARARRRPIPITAAIIAFSISPVSRARLPRSPPCSWESEGVCRTVARGHGCRRGRRLSQRGSPFCATCPRGPGSGAGDGGAGHHHRRVQITETPTWWSVTGRPNARIAECAVRTVISGVSR